MPSSFSDLGVHPAVVDALAQRGIETPFDIQSATIPDGLARRDILGRAPTGSGKTLAFGIPIVCNVGSAEPRRPLALILAPTRELATQIADELNPLARARKRWVTAVYGGASYEKQMKFIRKGVDILVATPGRLEDMIQQGDVSLDQVRNVVIDEADRMADMGFLPPVRRLLDQCHPKCQTTLFSATLDGDVAVLSREYQHDPVRHEVGPERPDITSMTHMFWSVERPERIETCARTIAGLYPTIVFVRTRHGADRVAKQLSRAGVDAVAIHGNRSQNQRERALASFTKGDSMALVATDVAARGVHVDGVESVIHFDPPEDHKTYIHRSGRTARAGAEGIVISLIAKSQRTASKKMQRKAGIDVAFTDPAMPDGDGLPDAPEPKKQRSNDQQRNNSKSKQGQRSGQSNRSGGGQGKGRSNGKPKHKSKNRSGGKPKSKHGKAQDHRDQGDSDRRSSSKPKRKKSSGKPKSKHGQKGGQQRRQDGSGKPKSKARKNRNNSGGQGKPGKRGRPNQKQSHAGRKAKNQRQR